VALVAVVALRAALGVWAAAVLTASVALAAGVAGWARLEARVFDRPCHPRPVADLASGSSDAAGHVAFARALAVLAVAYLAACEQQQREARQ
jgi:hypothetical protein